MSEQTASEITSAALGAVRARLDMLEDKALARVERLESAIYALGDALEDDAPAPWPVSYEERRHQQRQLRDQALNEIRELTAAIEDIGRRSTLDPITTARTDIIELEQAAA